jgi:DNA-binding CsgD family transcriptional regulator
MVAARFAPTLLERERETAHLERAWREAAAGRGSAWFICAEAGGGKTRLAREVARLAGNRGLWGAAEPVLPPEPFLPVIRAIPGFAPLPQQRASVEQAVSLLGRAAADGPVLCVLDDLHFADEATAAVLVRLVRECAARPWLILAAFRPGEEPAAVALAATELVADGSACRLDLAPLSREAVARLVADVRRRPPSPPELDRIYADSGGNPWFAEALARGNGAVGTARDRISLRLDRLERAHPGARAVLVALAPATRPLPHALAAALRGGDTPALRGIFTALRATGLLRETEDGAWTFRHELLRRSLLDALIVADRRDAHRALAEALAGHGSAAETAMHFEEAGDPRVVDWSLRAAREARAVDAHAEAFAQYERALRFEMDAELRRTTLREAAQQAYDLGRPAEILRCVDAALAIPGGRPEDLAALHQLAARAARRLGDLTADDAHLTAAERLLEGRPPSAQQASVAVARVARAALDVRPDRLAAASARALAVADSLDDAGTAAAVGAQVKSFLVVSLLDAGDPAGFATLEETLALVADHGLPAGVGVTALVNAYEEAVLSLFHREAAALYERSAEAIRRHELDWMPLIEPYRALELVQRGRYDDARALIDAVRPTATGVIERAVLLCAGAIAEARAGSMERAAALLGTTQESEPFQAVAFAQLAALEVAALTDAPELGELAQRVYGTTVRRRYARVAGVAAVALVRSGRGLATAPRWLVADVPLRVYWDWAAALNRHDSARLRQAAVRLAALDCPFEAALALADAGDLDGAYRGLRSLGATHARSVVAEGLRASGQPIPRRGRAEAAPGGLTETEQTVCRLVAAGQSNDQIAAALGISVRTVTTHLTRIYQKLGHSNRTTLALWWAQQDHA